MGTIVCKECDEIIAPVKSDKSEVIFGVCTDCNCNHSHKE